MNLRLDLLLISFWFSSNVVLTLLLYCLNYELLINLTRLCCCCCLSAKSCLTLCDPMNCTLPGSSVPGILQARALEWVAIAFFNAWKWKVKVKSLSWVWLLETPWTAAHQAPLSMGFARQEYWSSCHCLLHSFLWDRYSVFTRVHLKTWSSF